MARPSASRLPRIAATAIAAAGVLAGCNASGADAGEIAPVIVAEAPLTTLAPAPPPALPTTVPPGRTVEVVLHDAERLAARDGVTVAVSVGGTEVGRLHDDVALLEIPAIVGDVELELTYLTPTGAATEVTWNQTVVENSAHATVIQPWRRPDRSPAWHVLAWSRGADRDRAVAAIDGDSAITVHSPLTWFLDAEGALVGSPDADLIARAHVVGAAVWPAVQGIDADRIHALVTDDAHRRAAVEEIAAASAAARADGVNIDIEGFRNEDAADVSAFIEELAAAVHEWGGVVSYDLVPRSDSWDVIPEELAYWSTAPQRRRIAAAVDLTILMAYDQHNRFRPAGPVASPAWIEETLIYMLRYADPQDIILGLPAYGRIWDPAALDAPRAVSLGHLATLGGRRSPDAEFGIDRVDLDDGRFFWAEHEETSNRIGLAETYGLSGVAIWRLGLDSPALWEAFP